MEWLGVSLALGTSVSWAVGNVLTRRLARSVGPTSGMLWSMLTGAVLIAPFAALFDVRTAPITWAVWAWIAVAVVFGVLAYVGLFVAFAREMLTLTVPVVSSWALVACGVSIALGDVLRDAQWLGTGAVLGGVLLVSLSPRRIPPGAPENGSAPASGRALVAAIGSAIGFGVMLPAIGRIAPATGVFGATVTVSALGVALALPLALLAGVPLQLPPRFAWRLVIATGAVEMLGFVCIAAARRFAPMALVAPVASLASILTIVYAWAILRERPARLALAGALVAGLGLVVLSS